MIFSVLIPSIPERVNQLNLLLHRLESQISELPIEKEVEILVLMDNKIMSIGEKRERLKNMALGKYFCFLDDDDNISDDYISELFEPCRNKDVDVITFNTWCSIDGQIGTIIAKATHKENEQFVPSKETLRRPSHVNCWLTEKFREHKFSDKNYGEDFDFCNECYPYIKSDYHIDKILHYYIFDKNITQAF